MEMINKEYKNAISIQAISEISPFDKIPQHGRKNPNGETIDVTSLYFTRADLYGDRVEQ